jgi:hypothetical protein
MSFKMRAQHLALAALQLNEAAAEQQQAADSRP